MMNLPRADDATVTAFVAAVRDETPDPALLVNRNCTLRDYSAITAPSFSVDGEFVAYSSPDGPRFNSVRFYLESKRRLRIRYDPTPHVLEQCAGLPKELPDATWADYVR